jgi:glutaredoxin 3
MSIGHVEVWSKPDCIFCTKSKSILNNFNIQFEEKMLGVDFSREYVMEKFPTARSFPIVVVDGFYIGGYNQLEMKLNEEFKDNRRLLNEDNTL